MVMWPAWWMDLLGAELTGQNWTREWGGCLTHLAAPALGVWEARTPRGEEVGKEGDSFSARSVASGLSHPLILGL